MVTLPTSQAAPRIYSSTSHWVFCFICRFLQDTEQDIRDDLAGLSHFPVLYSSKGGVLLPISPDFIKHAPNLVYIHFGKIALEHEDFISGTGVAQLQVSISELRDRSITPPLWGKGEGLAHDASGRIILHKNTPVFNEVLISPFFDWTDSSYSSSSSWGSWQRAEAEVSFMWNMDNLRWDGRCSTYKKMNLLCIQQHREGMGWVWMLIIGFVKAKVKWYSTNKTK